MPLVPPPCPSLIACIHAYKGGDGQAINRQTGNKQQPDFPFSKKMVGASLLFRYL